jgi:hypothetical protein
MRPTYDHTRSDWILDAALDSSFHTLSRAETAHGVRELGVDGTICSLLLVCCASNAFSTLSSSLFVLSRLLWKFEWVDSSDL